MAPVDPMIQALLAVADGKQVRFDRFMETVLYHPGLGFFATRADRASREGDFITSPEVSPLFAECVATWIETTWQKAGRPEPFHVVEVGAGRGTLAALLLGAFERPFSRSVRLELVERGRAAHDALRQRFASHANVSVRRDVAELRPQLGAGVFVANELFDNLAVRRLMRAGGWKEIVVGIHGSQLREELVEAPPSLVEEAARQGITIHEGQTAEVREGAVPLLEGMLRRFATGGFLVFDYGGESDEVSGDGAPQGTLVAHRGHARHTDLYSDLGKQDITAHVNFTPLRKAAEALGYVPTVLESQSRFLLAHGLAERSVARIEAEKDPLQKLRLTTLAKQLYHPEAMGGSFRALHGRKLSPK